MPVGQPPFYFGGPQTLAEKRMPTLEELDRAVPNNPVCIAAVFANWGEPPGYTALNSLALNRLGIDAATSVSIPGVELVRAPATGALTGLIIDRNRRPRADFTLLQGITGFGFAERVEGLRRSLKAYNAVGTTTIYEGHGSSAETIAVYRALWEQQALTVRSHLCVSPAWASVEEGLDAMRNDLAHVAGRGTGDAYLRIRGVFLGIAGDAEAAAASRAALPNTGWAGFVEWSNSVDDFRRYAFAAAEHDLRVNTIVGDHIEAVLGVFEEVDARFPLMGRRWLIEHIKLMSPAQIARAKKLGLVVTTIPVYMIWKNGAGLTRGMSDLDDYVPHASLLEAGVTVATGTDNIPYNPFVTLQTVVERIERTSGEPLGARQSVSALDGLRMLTSHAAAICCEEQNLGTIEPGKLADLAVLDHDPLVVASHRLPDIIVEQTYVGGTLVHTTGS
jgi:predicted amidohydrolase YtcJ